MHSALHRLKSFKWCVLILVAGMSLPGCMTNIRRTPQGGARPRRGHFCLKKDNAQQPNTGQIDTEAVYVCRSVNDFPNIEGDFFYNFYRFFGSGQVYLSPSTNHFPTNAEINNLGEGFIGYYQTKGENIMMELFIPISTGHFKVMAGTIEEGKIVVGQDVHGCKWTSRRSPRRYRVVAYKVKEPWMEFWAEPDW